MRIFKGNELGPVIAAMLAFLPASSGWGEGGESTTESSNGKFSSLPFHVSVSVRAGYDDNVNAVSSPFEQGAAFASIAGVVSYDFGSPRTQVSLKAGGGFSPYLEEISGNDDYNSDVYLSLSAVHKVSPRLTLAANVYATYQTEPIFNQNVGTNRRNGNYFYTTDRISAAYLWRPRFSTVTSYTFVAVGYDEESIAVFEDRIQHIFGNEFRFLLTPTTSLIAEYRLQFITYDTAPKDSMSHFALAGFDHTLNSHFNLSFRGGAEFRQYDSTGTFGFFPEGNRIDPYFEGTLVYNLGQRSSISWTNRYSIEEPDAAGSLSRTTFRTGLSLRYDFTARISTNLGLFYQHDENDEVRSFFQFSPAFAEDVFSLSLSVRYAITPEWGIEAGYDFSDVESDNSFRTYTRNRISAGVNFSF